MKRKRKPGKAPPKAAKPPRNPFAKALGASLFRPKATKRRDAYVRRSKHRKPTTPGDAED